MTATPDKGQVTTLRGTVAEGVEAGCFLLTAQDGKQYLLLGGDRTVITAGGAIEVDAVLQPGLMTTCQQGIPASVRAVRRP